MTYEGVRIKEKPDFSSLRKVSKPPIFRLNADNHVESTRPKPGLLKLYQWNNPVFTFMRTLPLRVQEIPDHLRLVR